MKCSLSISNFLEEISSLSQSIFFLVFLCIDRWGRLSYLSLLFLGTLQSDEYIFPFLLCYSLLFISQLFVRPPQTAILPFCISFPWGWSWSLSPIQCHEPHFIVQEEPKCGNIKLHSTVLPLETGQVRILLYTSIPICIRHVYYFSTSFLFPSFLSPFSSFFPF